MAQGPEQDSEEVAALACLTQAVGRAQARRWLLAEGSARAALSRAALPEGAFERFRASLERTSQRLIGLADPAFPPLLREIPDPPLVLYVSGDLPTLSRPAVAVVGARRCTRSGTANAAAFARDIAALGLLVVSGLALGIDTAAHRGALETGATAAVLGSGLGQVYPASNRPLARAIMASGGALVSEYPPESGARNYHFPERNRLISGLSLGVVVVEAGEQSGSLITARLALEQGREVMAIPGPITNPVARGCHRLIRQGACLVETVADVLEALQIALPVSRTIASADPLRLAPPPGSEALLELLDSEVATLDELCFSSGLPAEVLLPLLVELELHGFVEQVPGGYSRRTPRSG
jgi:DNA processing protein